MWKEGSIRVNGSIFHYWIKQWDECSEFGIEGGRISKLTIKRDGVEVVNYDRGWDKKPSDHGAQLAMEIILHGENW